MDGDAPHAAARLLCAGVERVGNAARLACVVLTKTADKGLTHDSPECRARSASRRQFSRRPRAGRSGARTCPSASGARCARTTARTATPGTTSRTITPAAAPIAGARTASPASATTQQRLCLALALWNGRDPILKERLFGLTNGEGNHGEDVKELYYYLDATPTHSYLKMLYKYPQREFPYAQLVEENRRRGIGRSRSSSCSTPASSTTTAISTSSSSTPRPAPDDILMRVTVTTAGPTPPPLHLLPQLWFRNTWTWKPKRRKPPLRCRAAAHDRGRASGAGQLSPARRRRPGAAVLRQRDQRRRGCAAITRARGYFKDAFHEHVVQRPHRRGQSRSATGTKAAVCVLAARSPPARLGAVRLRLSQARTAQHRSRTSTRSSTARLREADAFYAQLQARHRRAPMRARVQRQAFAGMIWSKQFFYFDVPQWLNGDPAPAAAAAASAATAATATGCISTTPTSSRCRTSGNIPGTPPGTWRFTAFRWRIIDRGVRQGAARAADARVVHAPQRPDCRPTSGPSATSIRRCTPGRPGASSRSTASSAAAAATSRSSSASSTS